MQSNLNNAPNRRPMRLPASRLIGLLAGAMLVMLMALTDAAAARRAVVLEIDGAVGPAVADYVVRELGAMKPSDTGLVVLRMDTPGGLDTSMREIIRAILASPMPVATYVAPSGARAASAGTYIVYASAIAAMAPGTNLGAATPMQIGGAALGGRPGSRRSRRQERRRRKAASQQIRETRKIVNDAVAYIRGLAELHGRNADWAAEAVRDAASLPASEALKLQRHRRDRRRRAGSSAQDRRPDGNVAGKAERLATAGLEVVTVRPDWRTGLLAVITNPNVAYLLMLIGIYGLIFEILSTRARSLPGVIGGDQPAHGALRAQSAADQLCRRRARAARRRADGGRGLHRLFRRDRRRRHRRVRDRRRSSCSVRTRRDSGCRCRSSPPQRSWPPASFCSLLAAAPALPAQAASSPAAKR